MSPGGVRSCLAPHARTQPNNVVQCTVCAQAVQSLYLIPCMPRLRRKPPPPGRTIPGMCSMVHAHHTAFSQHCVGRSSSVPSHTHHNTLAKCIETHVTTWQRISVANHSPNSAQGMTEAELRAVEETSSPNPINCIRNAHLASYETPHQPCTLRRVAAAVSRHPQCCCCCCQCMQHAALARPPPTISALA